MRMSKESKVSVKLKRNSEISQEDHMNDGDIVDVTTENVTSKLGEDGWKLKFSPPYNGIAHLSVKVDGKHIRNSPYVITVKTLSLEEEDGAYVKMSDINDNVYKSMKKRVQFDVQYFEI